MSAVLCAVCKEPGRGTRKYRIVRVATEDRPKVQKTVGLCYVHEPAVAALLKDRPIRMSDRIKMPRGRLKPPSN